MDGPLWGGNKRDIFRVYLLNEGNLMLLSQRTIDKVVAKKKVFPQGEVRLLKANERAAPKQRSFQRHGVFLLAVMCSQLFSLRFTGVIYMGCVKEFAVPSFFSEC